MLSYTGSMPGSTKIIPLGGLGEVGKNMTVIEAEGEAVVIDAGLAFPRDEHLGVDLILPDFSYLVDRDRPVRAVLLTHGHEDHVGALPYLLREARVQEVWATRLTLGLIKSKLDEHGLLRSTELREAEPEGEPVPLGPFTAEFIRVAHSIPDAVAIVLDTPGGRILHTGDYKLDHTPVDGLRTDVGRLAELDRLAVRIGLAQLHRAQQSVLVELRLDQPESEPRRPDLLHAALAKQVRKRADVILVAVRQQHRADRPVAVDQVREVGQDQVDAEVLVARKREARVDHDGLAVGLDHGHVLPDLAEAAERDDPCASGHRRSLEG